MGQFVLAFDALNTGLVDDSSAVFLYHNQLLWKLIGSHTAN